MKQNGFPAIHLEMINGKKMQLSGYGGNISLYLALRERLLEEWDEDSSV